MKRFFAAIKGAFQNYLVAGLVTIIPIAVTIWILKILIFWADTFIKDFIPRFLYPENLFGRSIPGLGILATLILILLVGMLTRLYLGKKFLDWGDRLFSKMPLGKGIYKSVKDFIALVFGGEGKNLWKVALIEYPRRGVWAIAFVTGEAMGEIQDKTEKKVFNAFLPTTPNPTSGYLLMIPEEDLIFLDMKVDQAIKVIMSAGVVQEKGLPSS